MSDEKKKAGRTPEDDESTKGFATVPDTAAESTDAETFHMRKKSEGGSWEAAVPVHIASATGSKAEEPVETTQPLEAGAAEKASEETTQPMEAAAAEKASEETTQPMEAAAAEKASEETTQPMEAAAAAAVPEEQPEKKRIARWKIVTAAVALLVVAIVGGFSAYVYLWPTIFPGVTVAETYKLAGMTESEAEQYINETCSAEVLNHKIHVIAPKKTYDVDVSKLTTALDGAESAHDAYMIGREGGYTQRVKTVLTSMFQGWNVSVDAVLNEEAITNKVKRIYKRVEVDPVQPTWKVDTDAGTLTVDTGEKGTDFDKKQVISELSDRILHIDFSDYILPTYATDQEKPDTKAIAEDINCEPVNATVSKDGSNKITEAKVGVKISDEEIAKALGDATEKTYTIPVTITKAKVSKARLKKVLFRDTLASATTYYNSGQAARSTNVRLASYFCNQTILNPGETFSYNDVVGPRTTARGFRSAIIFSEGQEVEGTGGGICQVSSTMYMAVLRADLEVTERRNHQFQISYTPIAQDATVAYGSQDFKFKNNTDYPVKVVTSAGGGSMTVSIVGTKTSNKSVSLSSRVIGVSGRYKTAALYKTVTVDGKSTTTRENTSTYLLH